MAEGLRRALTRGPWSVGVGGFALPARRPPPLRVAALLCLRYIAPERRRSGSVLSGAGKEHPGRAGCPGARSPVF